MRVSIRSAVNRRRLLTTSASAALTAVSTIARPYLSFAADRPAITHGVQSGDVSVDSAVIWARATGRPACRWRFPPPTVST
jgi:alkaline phosphatase D